MIVQLVIEPKFCLCHGVQPDYRAKYTDAWLLLKYTFTANLSVPGLKSVDAIVDYRTDEHSIFRCSQ